MDAIDQQRPAGQVNPIQVIDVDPFFPHRFRSVTEHGSAIELL
jgi:hypothetical protein